VSIRTYFLIFINTSQHSRSFAKYESRIKTIGIKIPESIREKITAYLQRNSDTTDYTARLETADETVLNSIPR
jgi:hypothetical protein